MALHPTYFAKFFSAYNFIMSEPGPLPLHWRNYIAILVWLIICSFELQAASRHKCSHLVDEQEQEFIRNDGPPKWLEGLDAIPKKLHAICDVVQLLSHQPWLLSKENIEVLIYALIFCRPW
jgi:sestrin